jgi:hypothetical protein
MDFYVSYLEEGIVEEAQNMKKCTVPRNVTFL